MFEYKVITPTPLGNWLIPTPDREPGEALQSHARLQFALNLYAAEGWRVVVSLDPGFVLEREVEIPCPDDGAQIKLTPECGVTAGHDVPGNTHLVFTTRQGLDALAHEVVALQQEWPEQG